MSDDILAEEGLRERKRAATQATITKAAIELALEHGYDSVTVDMICEAGMISPRTFFNYFGSKEGVILGATPPLPAEDAIDAFVNHAESNVLSDFVTMITTTLVGHELDAELFRARRAVVQSTPELLSREAARMGEFEEQYVRIILDRFRAQGRDQNTTPDIEDEARMVVALAGGVMHSAMRKWFGTEFTGTPDELLSGSIALIRRITSNNGH